MARNTGQSRQPTRSDRRRPLDASQPPEISPPTRPANAWDRWGCLLVAAALGFCAYIPCLNNGFVSWDDDHYIYDNHQVHFTDGIKSIWFDVFRPVQKKFLRPGGEDRISHQYYPLVFSVYWLEFRYHVWMHGADPDKTLQQNIKDGKAFATSFHFVSMLLHAVNIILIICCLRHLGFSNWVAWAAAVLFAVHPMQVSTVAWAAERKNIIALLFYLLALMSYIKLRRDGKWWRYALALLLFQCALFSKTVTLTLPVILFFTDRLLERQWRPRWVVQSLARILPFIVLSGLAAWTTAHVEDRQRTIPLRDEHRPLVAAAAVWFYPSQMLLPLNQTPVYPLWKPNPADARWFVPLLGVITVAFLLVIFRQRLGQHFLWAVLFYLVTQGPMLGLKNINYFQFAFVADHYFYNSAIGLFLVVALALDALRRWLESPRLAAAVVYGIVGAAALACVVRSWTYCSTFVTADTFWQRVRDKNPECWPAYYNTGNARAREADELNRQAREIKPTDPEKALALEEEAIARFREAAAYYRKTIERKSDIYQPFDQLIGISIKSQDWAEVLRVCKQAAGQWPNKKDYVLQAAIAARKLKDWDTCVDYAQRATGLKPDNAESWDVLASCLASEGKVCQALRAEEQAVSRAAQSNLDPNRERQMQTAAERLREACVKAGGQDPPAPSR